MEPIRQSLLVANTSRDQTRAKGAWGTNEYAEELRSGTRAVKRPGLTAATVVSTFVLGQGIFNFNNSGYAIVGDTLYAFVPNPLWVSSDSSGGSGGGGSLPSVPPIIGNNGQPVPSVLPGAITATVYGSPPIVPANSWLVGGGAAASGVHSFYAAYSRVSDSLVGPSVLLASFFVTIGNAYYVLFTNQVPLSAAYNIVLYYFRPGVVNQRVVFTQAFGNLGQTVGGNLPDPLLWVASYTSYSL